MLARLNRSPHFVFIFLMILVLPQLVALGIQIKEGFIPLKHEPARVPFSWDMFAIRTERCMVNWNPPLDVNGMKISNLSDFRAPMEWNLNVDLPNAHLFAELMCKYAAGKTLIKTRCFLPEGNEVSDEFNCH